MIGGSASSPASGAPFRSPGRTTTGWPPPPAHQSDLLSRSFGIYSLFPGPGDAGALYTQAARIGHTATTFIGSHKGQLQTNTDASETTTESIQSDKINVIDLSADGGDKFKKIKPKTVNDICERLSEQNRSEDEKNKFKKEDEKLKRPSGGCSRTTPITPKPHSELRASMDIIIKKEPMEAYSKFLNSQYLSPNSFDTSSFPSPNMLRVSDSYLSSSTSFLSPASDSFLSPHSTTDHLNVDDSFRSSKVDEFHDKDKHGRHVATVTPCQVAEITSATSLPSPLILKQESSPGQEFCQTKKEVTYISSTVTSTGSSVPVGIAVARQRTTTQQSEIKISPCSRPPVVQPTAPLDIASAMGAVYPGGVACDDRTTNLITSWPAQTHNPALWQYTAPIEPYPPLPPVGFQLVRDPMTGHFLLIPAANIEALQRAILWPSYQPAPPQMILPQMPTTQHLLLEQNLPVPNTEMMSSEPRILITTDANTSADVKRKLPTLIKLENTDCSSAAVVVTACDTNSICSKTQVPSTEPTYFSSLPDIERRSQATSPVSCLSSERETLEPEVEETMTVQDASNQTDTPAQSDDEGDTSEDIKTEVETFEPIHRVSSGMGVETTKMDVGTGTNEVIHNTDVSIKREKTSPDLTGLQLLSNSIDTFIHKETPNEDVMLLQGLKNRYQDEPSANLGKLGILCALAEQRFREEVGESDNEEMETSENNETMEKIVELQRKYKEKQELLNKLMPRKDGTHLGSDHRKKGPGRPKKEKIYETPPSSPQSKRPHRKSKEMSPPILEKVTDIDLQDESSDSMVTRPPTLTPNTIVLPECNVSLFKLPVTPTEEVEEEEGQKDSKKRKLEDDNSSSSKKRKVGRPKKKLETEKELTETFVAKKTKKLSFVFHPISPVSDEQPVKKIKPKLKAEAKIKECPLEEDEFTSEIKIKTEVKEEPTLEEDDEKVITVLPSCVLTNEHLESARLPLRALTCMKGLFYGGQLSAIRAPDVYGITIDGERGNRPHIFSREEVLKDTILEVKVKDICQLQPGTRMCSYWSEQYRCLYPGTVTGVCDERSVNVDFDDGDNGSINIDDIRLIPQNYPVEEYDPNPLQSLGKRKRRISGASVDSQSQCKENKTPLAVPIPVNQNNQEPMVDQSIALERRCLIIKRREKLKRLQSLTPDGKKKHKKHEHKHHRHHKKHKKHKHKHGKKNHDEGHYNEDGDGAGDNMKKCKESVESRPKVAAFQPVRPWTWSGKSYRRPGAKGRARKEFHRAIQRGKEKIQVGDCAVFLSLGRPDRPYIGRIESMWESGNANMIVRVKWFYHPEEAVGCPATLEYPGGLLESCHTDINDVQTISHKCQVLPLHEYIRKLKEEPNLLAAVYDNNDMYYLAGYYNPKYGTDLRLEPGVKAV